MTNPTGERADLIDTFRKHRGLFRHTATGLTDEQARTRSTVSELTVGGVIKHVLNTEREWATFALEGPAERSDVNCADIDWSNPPAEVIAYQQQFTLLETETLAGVLAEYDEVAAATEALIASLDLDADHALPAAPWFEPGARWSNRRVFLHLIAETSQHAGHADIVREALDGQKSMG